MSDGDVCELLCLDLSRAEALRQAVLDADVAVAAARASRALGDETRLVLAHALATSGGELCVCDLAWISGRQQNLVSHHLRALRDAGLAASRKAGKMVMYRLTPTGQLLVDTLLSAAPT
jgi:DNA-binding transcriptional ArsR family regulator